MIDEKGATLTETCLLAALTVVVCLSSVGFLSSEAESTFNASCNAIKGAVDINSGAEPEVDPRIDRCGRDGGGGVDAVP